MALESELPYFRLRLVDILGVNDINRDKYAVVKTDDFQGMFDTYDEALEAGYSRNGLVPFLVKKIERNEPVFYFTRSI
jgi:hypothetical protein